MRAASWPITAHASVACTALAVLVAALPRPCGAAPTPDPAVAPQTAGWWERTDPGPGRSLPKSRYYTIRSDLPFETTKACADLLDTMYVEMMRLMQGLRPRGRQHLDVCMFAREEDYRQTLRTRFGVNATGSAGMFFISPKGSRLAFFVEGQPRRHLEHVIRHEAFHQLAHVYFDGDLPPWVDEGLADYFGESLVVDGTIIEGQPTAQTVARLRRLLENDGVIPFATLLSQTLKEWNAQVARGDASTNYLQSASMVHFLIWGEGGRLNGRFSAYLRHLNEGRDAVSAFRMAFGGTDASAMTDFERRWRAFVAAQAPGSARTAAEQLRFLADGVLFLRDRGIHPKSLEALRDALVREGFEQIDGETVVARDGRDGRDGEGGRGGHGASSRMRAGDIDLAIPVDHIQDARKPPVYVFAGGEAGGREATGRGARDGSRRDTPGRSGRRSGSGRDSRGAPEADGSDDGSSDPAGASGTPPPPPELSTRNLRPRDFRISWSQDPDGRWRAELRLK